MKITCTNFETSVALNEASQDQVLIAVSANCQLANQNSTLDLPDVAIFWFIDNLLRSCVKVARKQSATETFRDFYGEYAVTVRPFGTASATVDVETGDESFSTTVVFQELHEHVRSTLRLAESNQAGLSECLAFRDLREQLLGIALELASVPQSPDSPPQAPRG